MKPTTEQPKSSQTLDAANLDRYLRAKLRDLAGAIRIDPIRGGQSNPTFFVNYDNRSLVLRKQPVAPALLPSAHAIDREYRVMDALRASPVPVPETVLFEPDRTVIGTPFYIMERLSGRIFSDARLPGVPPTQRREMYRSMAQTMAELHTVDYGRYGLSDFGRTGNYFARQFARWSKQWKLSKVQDNPALDRVIAWLPDRIPTTEETTLCHGDFRVGNLMFHPTEPRVVGVLDWELSTLGHPLADVAFNCLAWRTLPEEYGGIRGLDLNDLGIPPESEYLGWYYGYAARSDRAQSFHYVFALFRLAVIFEGITARASAGAAAANNAHEVAHLGRAFAARALEIIEQDRC